jgi:tRNA(His) guanylyltransferase
MSLSLAGRMKRYEHIFRSFLPRRSWTLMRLDGRAFHSYTRDLERPYDESFAATMNATALALCNDISSVAFAYVQSDEISVLVTDFATHDTEPWMGGNVAKTLSISAARATATFNRLRPDSPEPGLFDCRAWSMSDPAEVGNYFLWRQRDATKNSISMAASAYFEESRLHGLTSGQRQELLWSEAGVNWNDYPAGFKRGRVVYRPLSTVSIGSKRTHYVIDEAPMFSGEADNWLARHIPRIP